MDQEPKRFYHSATLLWPLPCDMVLHHAGKYRYLHQNAPELLEAGAPEGLFGTILCS